MLGSKKRSATGIQISGRFLRVVEMERSRKSLSLLRLAEEELDRMFDPARLSEPGAREAVAARLRSLREEKGIRFARPCLSLDPRVFFLKRRPLPLGCPEKERRNQLLWEARQFLGEEQIADFSVDCVPGSRTGFVVAVRRGVLDHHLALCRAAGIQDVDVDIEPFALYNAAEQAGAWKGEGKEVVVDFSGERGTAVALLLEGGRLEAAACLSRAEAEESEWIGKIERWIRRESGGEAVERLCVSGENHAEPGAELGRRLELEPVVVDPFPGVDPSDPETPGEVPDAEAKARFAVAAGLAYRRLVE